MNVKPESSVISEGAESEFEIAAGQNVDRGRGKNAVNGKRTTVKGGWSLASVSVDQNLSKSSLL
jgi:hypothetical protein